MSTAKVSAEHLPLRFRHDPEREADHRYELGTLHAENALRPVWWRYRRAELLLQLGLVPDESSDDVWVQRCWQYLCDSWRRETTRREQRANLPRPDRAIHRAVAIWLAEDELPKWEIEARLLVDQPLADIAARMRKPTAVIEAFGALCFDAAMSRHSIPFLLYSAVGVRSGLFRKDLEIHDVWKLLGIVGGLDVLELVLDVYPGPTFMPAPRDYRLATPAQAAVLQLMVGLATEPLAESTPAKLKQLAESLFDCDLEKRGAPSIPKTPRSPKQNSRRKRAKNWQSGEDMFAELMLGNL